MRPVLITAVVLGTCALGSLFSPATSQPPNQLPELGAAAPGNPHELYGVYKPGAIKKEFLHRPATSCAAASCHGGGQVGSKGSEHSTWAPEAFPPKGEGDPHSKAYSVLFNPVSVAMAEKLDLKDAEGKTRDAQGNKTPAHRATLCLKCHAVESTSAKDPATRDQILSEGVGCSACHGPADKWIGIHYTPEWQAKSNYEKWNDYGFVPTKNLVARTLNCASCHVGDADRDVNHDLYAAGHPRTTFEAAAFHYQDGYRKHWTEKTRQPDFEVRAWVVGQAATLRSATELLLARADRAGKPEHTWPEFAGYSCYACHQKVGEGDVRGGASEAFKLRSPGVPGWEVWSNTAIEVAAEYCRDAYPGLSSPDLTAVKELRALMGKTRAPSPADVKTHATKALAALDTWLAAMQAADDDPKTGPVPKGTAGRLGHALAKNALAESGKFKDHDWDALAVNYLGCAAMYHASIDTTGAAPLPAWKKELDTLKAGLEFPRKSVPRFDSPVLYDRKKLDQLRKNFEDLRGATAPTGGN